MSAESLSARCRVCDRMYDGTQHLGIEACRACAAFFRRAASKGEQFVCRKGGERCRLDTSRKDSCQKCRFQKCILVGIRPEVFARKSRTKREVDMHISADKNELPQPGTSKQLETPPLPTVIIAPTNGYYGLVAAPRSLLQNVFKCYEKFCDDRIKLNAVEVKHRVIHVQGRVSELKHVELSMSNFNLTSEQFRREAPLMMSFLMDTFPEVHQLSIEHKEKSRRYFLPHFWEIECAYQTLKLLTEEEHGRKFVCTATTYMDLDDIEWQLDLDSNANEDDKRQLVEMMSKEMEIYSKTTYRSIRSIPLCDAEVAALLTLAFWMPRVHRDTPEHDAIATGVRDQVYDELHFVYRNEMRLDNYARRLGNLENILTDIQLGAMRFRQDMHLMKLFNMFRVDSYLFEEMRQNDMM